MPASTKAPHAQRQLESVNTPSARNNLPLSWLTQSARGRAYGPPRTPTPMLRATNTIHCLTKQYVSKRRIIPATRLHKGDAP